MGNQNEVRKNFGQRALDYRLSSTHADAQFDIVASRFAVHHFSDVKKALRDMCRVLKPGGK